MKREIGKNILKFIFFALCTYGIIRVSIWSYFQTQEFFIPFNEGGTSVISHAMALLSQYGQNVVLFLATIEAGRRIAYTNKISKVRENRAYVSILEEEIKKSQTASNIYYSLFAVFGLIDSGTNLGQFFNTAYKTAQSTIPAGIGLITFAIVGSLFSIVVVFVEELFMNTANALLHALNDIVESLGYERFKPLDLFVDPDKIIATRMDERNGKSGSYSNTAQSNPSSNHGNQNSHSGNNQQQRSQSQSPAMANLPRNNIKHETPMGYNTPQMDDSLRKELMKNIEDMKNKS